MDKKKKPSQSIINLPLKIVPSFFAIQPSANVSPLVKIRDVLQNHGVSKTRLCEAIAILLSIMSSKWGDPVPLIITEDEGAGAMELLYTCLNYVPENFWIDSTKLNKTNSGNSLTEGKTIIFYEAETSKDLLIQLLSEIERKNTLSLTKSSSISRNSFSSSFVAITKNPNNPLLQHPYITRIHISADQESKGERLKNLAKKSELDSFRQHKIESACIRTLLKRIKHLLLILSMLIK